MFLLFALSSIKGDPSEDLSYNMHDFSLFLKLGIVSEKQCSDMFKHVSGIEILRDK